MQAQALQGLVKLEQLILCGNRIRTIAVGALDWLPSLQGINLEVRPR